jgi:archaetidylinositol phosphate synthase
MTLDRLRPLADRALGPWVRLAGWAGLTPDGVSIIAFAMAVVAAVAFLLATPRWYAVGALAVFLNGWLDLVDGALARVEGSEAAEGDLLDHVLDRYADLIIIGALAAGIEAYAVGLLAVTGVLMTSYMGTQIQAVGLGRAYGGLIGRADRLALVVAASALVALGVTSVAGVGLLWLLLVGFGVVGHLTAVQRFADGWRRL